MSSRQLGVFCAALLGAALLPAAGAPPANTNSAPETGPFPAGTGPQPSPGSGLGVDFHSVAGLLDRIFPPAKVPDGKSAAPESQRWNFHLQNTVIFQGDVAFPVKYSGPHSLDPTGENGETVSIDIVAGLRLWSGAEFHLDGLYWQGQGLSNTSGVAGQTSGEAFRIGNKVGNINFTRIFLRQTIGLGGEQEDLADDQLHLAARQDISRLTLTLGRFSAKDIFDPNSYANDARTQFMNWTLLANGAWDFPADALGFTTGAVIELNQKAWALRYGFFEVTKVQNGTAIDLNVFDGWHMVAEFERRFSLNNHPGAIRLLGAVEHTHAGSYQDALASPVPPVAAPTEGYRYKYMLGLNLEQELVKDVGVFARVGWNDGKTEEWAFTDVDEHLSLGISVKGSFWSRPDDTIGLAGVLNGISPIHRRFLEAGGLGIDTGDGALRYGVEKIIETYYDFSLWNRLHAALDYQLISDPAYNRDRPGPVHIVSGRIHWDF